MYEINIYRCTFFALTKNVYDTHSIMLRGTLPWRTESIAKD